MIYWLKGEQVEEEQIELKPETCVSNKQDKQPENMTNMPLAAGTSFQKRSDVLNHQPHLNPDSKLICLAVRLLNERCAMYGLIALYLCIIIFYS